MTSAKHWEFAHQCKLLFLSWLLSHKFWNCNNSLEDGLFLWACTGNKGIDQSLCTTVVQALWQRTSDRLPDVHKSTLFHKVTPHHLNNLITNLITTDTEDLFSPLPVFFFFLAEHKHIIFFPKHSFYYTMKTRVTDETQYGTLAMHRRSVCIGHTVTVMS